MDKVLKTYKEMPSEFQWISPTKRIHREGIIPVGDLINVGDESQMEFQISHYTCYETLNYIDGYLLLSYSDYISINEKISLAEGFNLGNLTERYYSVTPSFAKIDKSYNDDGEEKYDLACVMHVSGQMQEKYPDVFDSLNFVTNVEYTDEFVDILKTEGLEKHTIDWLLRHYDRSGRTENGLSLWLESESPSEEMAPVIESLTSKGITVYVVQE